ncbi:MAG: hypothetical protein OSJ56_02675, partial [Prevotella sp.]|nr:hypothetical protein [Prevotella sp.]
MTNGRNNRSRILIYSASNGTHGNPTARTATDKEVRTTAKTDCDEVAHALKRAPRSRIKGY